MNTLKIEVTIEKDGELHLSSLPVRKGDRVEAILLCPSDKVQTQQSQIGDSMAAEARREAARTEFLELAKASEFRSSGRYPTREELHERH